MNDASRTFHSDAWRHTGASHEVCEDYCVARAGPHAGHAIISDGCSSEPDTDLGAAIVARSLQGALAFLVDEPDDDWRPLVWYEAQHVGTAMRLPEVALTATVVAAVARPDACRTFLWGDGVVAVRARRGGEWLLTRHVFADEAPYYLRYEGDPRMLATFARHTRVTRQHVCLTADGRVAGPLREQPLELADALESMSWDWADFDMVVVMSDGVGSVRHDGTKTPLDWVDAARALLAFRNTHGEFVARRARRVWRDWTRQGLAPADDLSVAAIRAEPADVAVAAKEVAR